jgi:flagellar motor switch protein FliM
MDPQTISGAPGRQRIGLPRLQRLRTLHEDWARGLGTSLSALLRTPVVVTLDSIEQLTYGQFAYNVETPACFYVLKADALNDRAMLDVEPSILHPMIDRLLGGEDGSAPERPLTEIEWCLATRLVRLFLEECQAAWNGVVDLRLEVLQTESDPRLLRALPAEEPVLLVSFRVAMGELWGDVRFCLPARAVERLNERLSSPAPAPLTQPAAGPLAEVRVTLAETPIAEAQLADLRVGDIIATETAAGSPAVVSIDGVARFHAKAGVCRGQKAVCITETLESPAEGAAAGSSSSAVDSTDIVPVTEPEGATAGLSSSVELRIDNPSVPAPGTPRPAMRRRRDASATGPRQKKPHHE